MGKILNVDLTGGTTSQQSLDRDLARKYIGGVGFGVKIVYDEVPPGVDAFDPETPVVFSTGPLTGTPFPGSGAFAVTTKSPLTGFTIGHAQANGLFGAKLKRAGYDVIVVRGHSLKPVYLWVENGKAELRDASKFWGSNARESEESIKEAVRQPQASVACIGPAGENKVRYAAIYSDRGHIAASGGVGAVMGSKNLKAIAVHGSGKTPVADRKTLEEISSECREALMQTPGIQSLRDFGTAGSLEMIHRMGDLPTRNLTTNVFPDYPKLTGLYIRKNFDTKPKASCFRCPVNHVHMFEITEGPYKGFCGEEPEYEGISAFGSNLGISDTAAVLFISNLADSLGMDCKAVSFVISLCMECYEKGLLSREDLGGIDLTWGNADGVVKLLEKIANREGIGDILAEGAGRAAEHIGGDAPRFAVHVKGAGIHNHDFRAAWGMGLSHVISSFAGTKEGLGTDFGPDPDLGYPVSLNPLDRAGHAEAVRKTGLKEMFSDCGIICLFLVRRRLPWSSLVDALNAATGEGYSIDEVQMAQERIKCLGRAFAIRHGLKPQDDWPSERLLEAPKDGPAAGRSWRPYLKGMVAEYYRCMGWDEKTSKPLRQTLKRLDLDYVINDIWE